MTGWRGSWGVKCSSGDLGRWSPRDQSPLEKDHPGNQAYLGLWRQFAGERGTSTMFRAGTLDDCSAPKLWEEFMAAQQMD